MPSAQNVQFLINPALPNCLHYCRDVSSSQLYIPNVALHFSLNSSSVINPRASSMINPRAYGSFNRLISARVFCLVWKFCRASLSSLPACERETFASVTVFLVSRGIPQSSLKFLNSLNICEMSSPACFKWSFFVGLFP